MYSAETGHDGKTGSRVHVIRKGSGLVCWTSLLTVSEAFAHVPQTFELIIRRDPRFCGGELCHQLDRNGPLTA